MKKELDGYNDDIDYTYDYYSDWSPQKIRLGCVARGIKPPEINSYCELGFGQGLSLNVLATVSNMKCYGTDFNDSQVTFAKDISNVTKNGAMIYNKSFQEFSKLKKLPKFDLIVLHGILSWVSIENHKILFNFIKNNISKNGIVYLSYNSKPGADSFMPARHILMKLKKEIAKTNKPINEQINIIFESIEKLNLTNPLYLEAFSRIKQNIQEMKEKSASYLIHEYFNEDWHSFYYSEIETLLSKCNLKYIGQSRFNEDMESINFTQEQREYLSNIPANFKEDIKDTILNNRFRRDLWTNCYSSLDEEILEQYIIYQKVTLSVPREYLQLTIKTKIYQIELPKELYGTVLTFLSDYHLKTLREIQNIINVTNSQIIEIVAILNSAGIVGLAVDDTISNTNKNKCDLFNEIVLKESFVGFRLKILASPVVSEGLTIVNLETYILCNGYKNLIRDENEQADYLVKYYVDKNLSVKLESGFSNNIDDLKQFALNISKKFNTIWVPFFKAHKILS